MHKVNQYFVFYALFAFLLSMIREIVKDIEDVKGDSALGCRTLPVVAGVDLTKWIVVGVTLSTLALLAYSQIVFYRQEMIWMLFYFILVVDIPIIYLLQKLLMAKEKEDFHFISSLAKMIIFAGILSMQLLII